MIIKNKMQVAFSLFATDVMLSIWSYFQLSNYSEFMKAAKIYNDNPEMLEQVYQTLTLGFIITLLCFNLLHLVIYVLYTRHHKLATKYILFYTILAAISSLILMGTGNLFIGLISFCAYAINYSTVKKLNRKIEHK